MSRGVIFRLVGITADKKKKSFKIVDIGQRPILSELRGALR